MKRLGFLFFLMAMVVITLSSSTCRKVDDPEPVEIPCDTCNNQNNNPNEATLKVMVRLYTVSGFPAGGATVKIARTFDSAFQEQYFLTGVTDTNGLVTFNKMYAPIDGKKYYIDAFMSYAGEDLRTKGAVETNLKKSLVVNENVVVEP